METAIKIVNKAVNRHLGRKLNPPEETIIKGTWQKIGYREMEKTSEFSRNYLMRDVAPRLWKLLSHIFGRQVNKHNFRSVLENLSVNFQQPETFQPKNSIDLLHSSQSSKIAKGTLAEERSPQYLETKDFIGRSQELNTLKQWILNERVQLVSVIGIPGMGKTVLCQKFVELYQHNFDFIVWLQIAQSMSDEELLARLFKKVTSIIQIEYDSDRNKLGQLLAVIKEQRGLLILDNVNPLLRSHDARDYREFWQKVTVEPHQSCLLLNGLKNFPEIGLQLRKQSPVRSLLLSGFSLEDARLFLGEDSQQSDWDRLIEIYQGNPLALKVARETVQNIFHGNVTEFVAQSAFIFGEIEEMFDKLFLNLSALEQKILYQLTIESKPVALKQIQTNIASLTSAELIESLVSLEKRGLLETPQIKEQSLFTVREAIAAYISKKLIERVSSTVKFDENEGIDPVEDVIDLGAPAKPKQVNLTNWLKGNFEADWQLIEKLLLNTKQLTSRLRGAYYLEAGKSLKRCKLVTMGDTNNSQIVLLIELKHSTEKILIRVQVYPAPDKNVLPANLKLSLIDASGNSLRQVISRSEDNFIQLPLFQGKSPEKFSIGLALNKFSWQENFVI